MSDGQMTKKQEEMWGLLEFIVNTNINAPTILEWKENDKGNWVVDTPSGSTMVVFKRDDKWNYSCSRRGAMTATFGDVAYDNAKDLMKWIESKTDMDATPAAITYDGPMDYDCDEI